MSFQSFMLLPKEIRLQIYMLAYQAQGPRLVALRTKPHEEDHEHHIFCPRYSPSPAPHVINLCREAREEISHQARKLGHVAQLHIGQLSDQNRDFTEEFFFRCDIDILYLPLDDKHVQHHDDDPDSGLLSHFRHAVGCDTSALRNLAITKVVWSGYRDGAFSNSLREFPNVTRIVMMVPFEARSDPAKKAMFVRAARRIVTLYKFDIRQLRDELETPMAVDVDFAILVKGRLEVMSKGKWKDWSDVGIDWVERDGPAQFYESMSW